jgi:HPt (histidine-containing phosphotransfer) domain-containing protein
VLRFPGDQSFQELETAIQAGDVEGTFKAAHTLKGVALNLGIAPLGETASILTEQVRGGNPDFPAAVETFVKVKEIYEDVIEKIGQIA